MYPPLCVLIYLLVFICMHARTHTHTRTRTRTHTPHAHTYIYLNILHNNNINIIYLTSVNNVDILAGRTFGCCQWSDGSTRLATSLWTWPGPIVTSFVSGQLVHKCVVGAVALTPTIQRLSSQHVDTAAVLCWSYITYKTVTSCPRVLIEVCALRGTLCALACNAGLHYLTVQGHCFTIVPRLWTGQCHIKLMHCKQKEDKTII